MPAVGQLVDHGMQPPPEPSSQPEALYVPDAHGDVPPVQPPLLPPLHVLLLAIHVPGEHTQPEKSDEDVELAGHVSSHVVATVEPTLIAVAWNAPDAHAVQVMLAVELPAVE